MATKESQMKKSKVSNFWDGARNIGSNLVKDAKAIGGATGRHIGGGIIEFVSEIMPGGQSIVEAFPDIFADVKKAMGASQSAIEKEAKSILRLPTYRGILDWYTAKEDSYGGLMNDADSELNFDVGESSVTSGSSDETPDNSAADELTAEFKIADKASDKISATVVETSKKNAELQVATLASITNALDKTNSIITAGFENLNKSIGDLTKIVTDNTSAIIKILEIGKQLDQENASRSSNNDTLTYADLLSGRFDIKKYAKTIGNKFNEKLGMLDMFNNDMIDKRVMLLNMGLSFIPGLSDIDISSPKEMVKWGLDKLTDAFLPDLRKGLASIDTGITKWIQQTVLDLGQGFFMGQKIQGDFWNNILELFGIGKESGRLKRIEKNDFEKKQISFDTETKESIVKVIPAYLEKITNALTGESLHYDLKQRKLRKKSEIQASYLQEKTNILQNNISTSEMNEVIRDALAGTQYEDNEYDLSEDTGPMKLFFIQMIRKLYIQIIQGWNSTEELLAEFGKTEAQISNHICINYLGKTGGFADLKDNKEREAVIKLARMIAAIVQQPERIKSLTRNAYNYQKGINDFHEETNKFYENQNALDLFEEINNKPEEEDKFIELSGKTLNSLLNKQIKYSKLLRLMNVLKVPGITSNPNNIGKLTKEFQELWEYEDNVNEKVKLQKIFNEFIRAKDELKNQSKGFKNNYGDTFKYEDLANLFNGFNHNADNNIDNLTSESFKTIQFDENKNEVKKFVNALSDYLENELRDQIYESESTVAKAYGDSKSKINSEDVNKLIEISHTTKEEITQKLEVTFPDQLRTDFENLADNFKSILVGNESKSFTEIFKEQANFGFERLDKIYKLIDEKQFNVIVQRINKQANEPKTEPKNISSASTPVQPTASKDTYNTNLNSQLKEILDEPTPVKESIELINPEKEVLTKDGLNFATTNDNYSNNRKTTIRNIIKSYLISGQIENQNTRLINTNEFTPERVNALAAKYNIDKKSISSSIIQTVQVSDTNLVSKPVSAANSSKVEQSKGLQSVQDGFKKLISTATGGGGGSQAASEAVNQIVKGSIDMVAEPVIKPMQESLKPIGQHINATIFGGTFEEKVVDSKGNVKTVVKKVPEGGLLGFAQEKVGNFFKNLIPSEDKINKVNKDVAKQAKRFASNFKSKDKNGKPIPGTFDWEGLVGRIVGGLGGGALAGPIGSIIGVMVGNLLPIAPIGNAIKNFVVGDLFDKHADPKNPKMGFFEKVFFNWFIPFKTEFGKTMKFLFANVKRNIIGPFLTFGAGIGALFKNGFKGIGQMPWFKSLSNWWKNTPIGKGFKWLGDKVSGFFRMFFGGIGRLITGGLARLFGGLTRGAIGAGTGVVGVGGGIINSILGAVGGKEVREAMKRQNQLNTAAYNKDLSKNGLLSISGAVGELLRGNTGYVKRMFTDKDSVDWWWSNASEIKREREGWLNTRATIRDFFTGGNEAAEALPPKTKAEEAQIDSAKTLRAIASNQGVKLDSNSNSEIQIKADQAKKEAQHQEQKAIEQQGDQLQMTAAGHAIDSLNDQIMSGELTRQEASTAMSRVNAKLPNHLKPYAKKAQWLTLAATAGRLKRTGHEEGLWGKIKDWIGMALPAVGSFFSSIFGGIAPFLAAAGPLLLEALPWIGGIGLAVGGIWTIIHNWGNIGEWIKGIGKKVGIVASDIGDSVSAGWKAETKGDRLRNSAFGKTAIKGVGQIGVQAAVDISERQLLFQGRKDAKAIIKDAAAKANKWAAVSEGNSRRITEASKNFNEALAKNPFASDQEFVNTMNQAKNYERKAKESAEKLANLKGKYGQLANMTDDELKEVAKTTGLKRVRQGVILSLAGLAAMGAIELALKSLISWICLKVLKLSEEETIEICLNIMKYGDVVLFLIPQSFYQKIALGVWNLLKGSFEFMFKKVPEKLGNMFKAAKNSWSKMKDLGKIIQNAFKPKNLADTALKKIEAGATKASSEAIEKTVTEGAAKIGVEATKAGGVNWPEIIIMGAVGSVIGNLTWPEAFEIPEGAMQGITGDYQNKMKNISVAINGLFWGIPNGFIAEMVMELLLSPDGNMGKGILSFFLEKGYQIPSTTSTFKGLLCWIFLNLLSEDKKAELETVVKQTASSNEMWNKVKEEYGLTDEESASERQASTTFGGLGKHFTSNSMYKKTTGNSDWFGSKTRTATMFKNKRLLKAGSIQEGMKKGSDNGWEDINTVARTTKGGKILSEDSIWNQGAIKYWIEKFGVDINNPDNVEEKTVRDSAGNVFTGYQIIGEPGTKALFHFDPFIDLNGDSKKVPEIVAFKEYLRSYLGKMAQYLISHNPRYYSFLNSIKGAGDIIPEYASYDNDALKTGSKNDLIVTYIDNKGKKRTKNALWAFSKILRNAYNNDITKENIIRNGGIHKLFQKGLETFNRENLENFVKYDLKQELPNIKDFLRKVGEGIDFTNEQEEKPDLLNAKYDLAKQALSKMIGMGEGEQNQNNKQDQYYQMMKEDPALNAQFMGDKYSGEFREIYIDYWRIKNWQSPKYHKDKNELIDAYRSYKNNQFYKNRADLVRSNRETQASNAQASAKVATQSSKSNNKDAVKAKIATKAEAGKDSTVNSSKVAEAEKTMEAIANPAPEGSLVYPVTNYKSFPITSPFGPRWGKFHKGIDLGIPERTPLLAMADGIVTGVGYEAGGYGHWITYKIPSNGLNVIYGHLCEAPKVSKGTAIKKGQIIALSGNTGHSTGPHLHLEIRKGQPGSTDDWDSSQPMNPEQVLEGLTSVAGFNGENSGTAGTANGSSSKTGGLLGWLQNSSPYGSLLKWLGSIFTGNQESSGSENTSGGVSSAGAANMSIAASDANREKIYKMLRNKGYSPEAAIGILANIEAESTYRTNVLSYDGEGSIGICQWTYGRRTNLENYARSKGKPVSDLETQVEYLIRELEGPYKKVNALKNTNDYGLMAERFCRDFEVPANVEVRVGERRNIASKLAPILMKLENEPTGSTQISMTNIATQYGMAGGLGDSFADLNPFKSIQNTFNNLDTSSITSVVSPQLPGLTNVNADQPLSTTVSQTKAITKDKNIEEKMDIMIAIFTQLLQLIKQGNNISNTANGFLESMMNLSNTEKQKVLDKIREKQRNSSNHYSPNIYPMAIQGLVGGF